MVTINKRNFLGAPLAAAFGLAVPAGVMAQTAADGGKTAGACVPGPAPAPNYDLPVAAGPFRPEMESLKSYQTPDWFRDAKFGIWGHWGPQAVPRAGDWYARNMYVPEHPHYGHHLKTYGHPSKFGYKDIIPLWTAEKWDPEALMDKYAAAGAKYFVSMGVHHDNFDLWNSKHHRWNAVAMGPKRDVVGTWKAAAQKRGLRFGVSEHLGASHNWFHPSHAFAQFWPEMGADYDGADPAFSDLYHPKHDEPYRGSRATWYTHNPKFHQIWFNRMRDLVDNYQPDLLYSDGGLPFGVVGRSLLSHLYNVSLTAHGKTDAVYNCKSTGSGEYDPAMCVLDVERGGLKGISDRPWQTCTSNGDWFYSDGYAYKTAPDVIYMLSDIVSKNGNLLLNVVLHPDGSLPPESQTLLDELAVWMKVNGEAIHGTRPWTVFGEGPTETAEGPFTEKASYSSSDIRFTTNRDTLYAVTLGEPRQSVVIKSLGRRAGHLKRPIRQVQLLGDPLPLHFRQSQDALIVDLPESLPTRHASAFKISS